MQRKKYSVSVVVLFPRAFSYERNNRPDAGFNRNIHRRKKPAYRYDAADVFH